MDEIKPKNTQIKGKHATNSRPPKGGKFSLYKNFLHTLAGLLEVSKNEKPMQLELVVLALALVLMFFIDLEIYKKIILILSIFFVIFAELVNSAIERVVDLATSDYHPLAKAAKDAGSAIVFVAIVISLGIWGIILTQKYLPNII